MQLSPEAQARLQDLQLQLTEVRDAQRAVISSGQQYTIRGRSLTRASLAELRKEEASLLNEIARLTHFPGRTRRMVFWERWGNGGSPGGGSEWLPR